MPTLGTCRGTGSLYAERVLKWLRIRGGLWGLGGMPLQFLGAVGFVPGSEIVDPEVVNLPMSLTKAEPGIHCLEGLAEVTLPRHAELCKVGEYLARTMDLTPV